MTFLGHDRLGEEMVRQVCGRLRTSERLSRFLAGRDPPPPDARLPRARAAARPPRGLPLPDAHLARRGRGDPPVVRRPARHPRPERRARHRRAPGARARADARRARLAAHRPAAAPAPRRRAGARGGHRARARAGPRPGGAAGGRLRRARSRIATMRSSSPGACATMPSRDRRLRRSTRTARRDGRVELEHAYDERATSRAGSSGSACTSPTPEEFDSIQREFDLHPLAVEDAIHAHQRPKLEVVRRDGLPRAEDRALRRPDGGRRARRAARLPAGPDYRDHGPPRRGQLAARTSREALEARPRAAQATGRARRSTRSWTRWSTTTSPPSTGSRTTSTRSRSELFSAERTNVAERIYKLQRETLQLPPADRAARRPARPARARAATCMIHHESATTSAT